MKLHLGCGTKIIDGYVNVDIRPELNCDIVDDIKNLNTFENDVAEEIYACHVLEHFSRHEYKEVLKRWFNVLKKEGILKLSVPNLEKVFEKYSEGTDLKILMGLLYGGQTYPENYHYVGFDYKTLEKDLLEIGFTEIGLWDWRLTSHSHIDDFSQCYLPHMDKDKGTLMSLNIKAVK